jgi:hypothetical protein
VWPGLRTASRCLAIFVAVFLATCPAEGLAATQSASLRASFSPEHLGAPTMVSIGFRISSVPVGSSVPLTSVSMLLPNEMGLATSGLGLENCIVAQLETRGPDGCPTDARMGLGAATAEIPIGGEPVVESAQIEVFSSRVQEGRLALLVYANAQFPVSAQLVFPATVVPAFPPYGEGVDTEVPLIPTVPGGPDVAVTRFQMTLGTTVSGPDSFVYYRTVEGRQVAYSPRGLLLPPVCPRGGFPFGAQFTFQDHSVATAHTTVPCPSETRRTRRRHRQSVR